MKCFLILLLPLIAFAQDFPDVPAGWSTDAIQKCRTPSELYDYMDGGAELYLEYRFRKLLVREYHHAKDGDITAEIYQFDEPADACGVFRLDRTGLPLHLGQEGRGPDTTGSGSFRFWKGSRYVRLFAWQAHDGLRPALDSLARNLDALQPPAARLPDWLARLDSAGLSPVFLSGEIALRNAVALAAGAAAPAFGDLAGIPLRAGAAYLRPAPGSNDPPCLIIHAADDKAAEEIFHKIQQQETVDSSAVERFGQNVIWIPKAADEAACVETLDKIKTILQPEGEP